MPDVWADMQAFTDARQAGTSDEIWFVEHPPVYTLGMNADPSHLLDAAGIPVIRTDRGGQITYHGPGQLVCYVLLDVKRRRMSVRNLVETLESAVVDTVAQYGIEAYGRRDAPGVYVDAAKIAAIGLRIRRGGSYHGLALNVNMDLEPFRRIHPCGFADLAVTQLVDLCGVGDLQRVRCDLEAQLMSRLDVGAGRGTGRVRSAGFAGSSCS